MTFNQISQCLSAQIIDQHEAYAMNEWLDSIDTSIDNRVPDALFEIVEKMCLYLNPTVGGVQ